MASKGTRITALAFGGYQVGISLKKAHVGRDLKTCYVNGAGEKVTMGGGAGGSRTPAPGVEKAADLGGGQYVRLPAGELEEIAERSTRRWERMEVLEAIDAGGVPWRRMLGAYWVQPHGGTAKGLRLLAGALHRLGRVAVVKWCGQSREKLGALCAVETDDGLALLLCELAFANDFAGPDADALSINLPEVTQAELDAAEQLVEAFTRPADGPVLVDAASDEAVDARLALLDRILGERATEALEASAAAVA